MQPSVFHCSEDSSQYEQSTGTVSSREMQSASKETDEVDGGGGRIGRRNVMFVPGGRSDSMPVMGFAHMISTTGELTMESEESGFGT